MSSPVGAVTAIVGTDSMVGYVQDGTGRVSVSVSLDEFTVSGDAEKCGPMLAKKLRQHANTLLVMADQAEALVPKLMAEPPVKPKAAPPQPRKRKQPKRLKLHSKAPKVAIA